MNEYFIRVNDDTSLVISAERLTVGPSGAVFHCLDEDGVPELVAHIQEYTNIHKVTHNE